MGSGSIIGSKIYLILTLTLPSIHQKCLCGPLYHDITSLDDYLVYLSYLYISSPKTLNHYSAYTYKAVTIFTNNHFHAFLNIVKACMC